MHMSGNRLAKALSRPIEQVINQIEGYPIASPFKITLRGVGSMTPAVASSLLLPTTAPFFVIMSMAIIYIAFEPIQEKLFHLTSAERHWMVCVPIYIFYLIWGGLLLIHETPNQINQTVGAIVFMSTVAMWPVYFSTKKTKIDKRKISFKVSYLVIAALVLIQQVFVILGSVF